MGILEGKRVLITGVLTDASLAYGIAETALQEGAHIVLTGAGRGMGLTTRMGRKLATGAGLEADAVEVLELDVTVPDHFDALTERLMTKWGGIDAALHAIGFAPASLLGSGMWPGAWDDVAMAMQISAYSMKPLAQALLPLWEAAGGGSYVGLTFDATVAWPAYDWMGVAKAAMESLNRYLARDLGPHKVRSNLIAAGPIKTMAAKSIPGFSKFEDRWTELAPLGWDVNDSSAVAKSVVAMMSDWFPSTTGEIIHVDGGYHAVGA
jgi:meromycolic acid enoyl-[acyl-carrier-protein] reductase